MSNKTKEYKRIWVHSSFKNQLKSEASLEGKKLVDYTKELAEKQERRPQKREKFNFRL